MTARILPDLPPVMTVPYIAKVLECSPPTVYTIIREGKLRAITFRTGTGRKTQRGTVRVLAEDLRAFISNNRTSENGGPR